MNSHWQALGWTLVHFLWQGAVIALLYRVFDLALARRSANARYLLALATLFAMFAASLATLGYEESSLHPAAALVPGSAAPAQWASLQAAAMSAGAASVTAVQAARRLLLSRALPYLDLLWLAGVVFLTLRALGGWWLLRRLRLGPLHPAPHKLLFRLNVIRLQMGVSRLVELRLSSHITNPLTAGVLRPWILLPLAAVTRLSPEQIEVVLSHELAHIRRRDYLWNILQTVVETLFFFHPAVWWISRRVREERELCCDDAALARCPDPSVYASALLRLEEERRNYLRLAVALDGHQSRAGLRARIRRILGDPEASPRSARPLSLAGVAVAAAVFFCPMPKLFASFRAVPRAATSITRVVSSAVHRNLHSAIAVATQSTPTGEPAPAPQAKPPAAPPTPPPDTSPAATPQATPEPAPETSGPDYIDQMRAAGYNVDLDKYVAMKVQGITPAYARAMSQAFGVQLTADNLVAAKVQGVTPDVVAAMAKEIGAAPTIDTVIAMKVQDVTPEYITQMKAAGYDAPANQLIAMKVQNITPEYAEAMAKLGFGKPTADELIALKVQGITPDYAQKLRASGIEASSFNDLISDRIFEVSPEFIAQMKDAGFPNIPPHKLIELRVQGVTPEFARATKAQFPDATLDELVQLRIFHIDAAFIASAQRHGFTGLTIEKLVRLRISGVLDDADAKNSKESNQ